ncbi:MAG: hypothetical protein Q4G48_01275 [Bacteroidia bacterium]|nr:hypothetical protein [Bacteroidia bacterium]
MKRKIAVFLLSVMALVAVQPVIAMHFCEGKLHSWDLFVNNNDTSCCETKTAEPHFCCSPNLSENHPCSLNESHDGCCDFETIRVSTDVYQNKTQEINPDKPSFSFDNVWFALTHLRKNTLSEPNTPLPQKTFPPDGLFLQDVSILNYICIYRL